MAAHALQAAARTSDVNAKNAFASLPETILRRILGQQLLIYDIIAVSQSCHRLRSVTLALPDIWNERVVLRLLPQDDLGFQRVLIERSKPNSLEMCLFVAGLPEPSSWTEGCCQIVTENMDRLSRLTLVTELDTSPTVVFDIWGQPTLSVSWGSCMNESQWDVISQALEHPAPLLQHLVLYRCVYKPHRPLVLPTDLFCGDAPLLRSCTLNGVLLPKRVYPAFRHLVTLHYHAWHGSPTLRLEVIRQLLVDIPTLEMLCLSSHLLSSESELRAEDTHSPSADVKGAFNTVRISSVLPGSLHFGPTHDFFRSCGAQTFECEYTRPLPEFVDAVGIMQAFPRVESMALRIPYAEICCDSNTLHVRWEPRFGALTLIEPPMYDRLEHLTLEEWFWPQGGALPVAPRLTSLCVVLGSCASYRSRASMGPLFDAGTCSIFHSEHPWPCPALRLVHLAYSPPENGERCHDHHDWDESEPAACCCADTLAVSFRDAHRFVTTCLRFESDTLMLFKMSGVEPIDPESRDLLDAIAEDVQISTVVDQTAVAEAEWRSCTDW